MEALQARIKASGRKVKVFLTILLILSCAVLAMGLLSVATLPWEAEKAAEMNWIGEGGRSVTGEILSLTKGGKTARLGSITVSVMGLFRQGLLCAALWLARRIFRDIEQEYTPFLEKHVRRLSTIAWLLLASSLLFPLLQVSAFLLLPSLGRGTLTAEMDLLGVICAALLFCVARIFQYGCELQRFSDETL